MNRKPPIAGTREWAQQPDRYVTRAELMTFITRYHAVTTWRGSLRRLAQIVGGSRLKAFVTAKLRRRAR